MFGGGGGTLPIDLREARTFLEPRWKKLKGKGEPTAAASDGMSRPTAFFLHLALNGGAGSTWTVEGGYCMVQFSETTEFEWPRLGEAYDPRTRKTYIGASKSPGQRYWHDGKRMMGQHFWLRSGKAAVDIAGDQYGWPEVFFGTFSESRYKKFDKLSGLGALLDVKDLGLSWFKDWTSR